MSNFKTNKDDESLQTSDVAGKPKGFCRLFSRFAEKTSMVGVPYINSSRYWWAKAIWAFLLLVAVAAMSLHLWYLLSQWYSWPKSTTVSLGFSNLAFPQVTICNINTLHRRRFEEYEGAEELKSLIRRKLKSLKPDEQTSTRTETTTIGEITTIIPISEIPLNDAGAGTTDPIYNYDEYSYDYIEYSGDGDDYDYSGDDFGTGDSYYGQEVANGTIFKQKYTDLYMSINKSERERMGHQIEDMLLDCTFNGRVCNSSLFKLHQMSDFGNCWTVSLNQFTVTKSGPKGGLSLILFLESNEYIRGITEGYGVRLDVKQRHTYPFPADEGMFIPVAMETDIGLRMLRIERLGGNYGVCNTGIEFRRLYNLTYSRRACQTVCKISMEIKECGCFEDFEELAQMINKTFQRCRTGNDSVCLQRIRLNLYDDERDCDCANPCKEIAYVKSVSQRQWPTNEDSAVSLALVCKKDPYYCTKLQEERGNDSQRNLNLEFLKLNIYYEDLNFEDLQEEPQIAVQQLLSDVGGAIGLWIGLSILSLCELLQLGVELCNFIVHKTAKPKGENKPKLRQEREYGSKQSKKRMVSKKSRKKRVHANKKLSVLNRQRSNNLRTRYLDQGGWPFRNPRDIAAESIDSRYIRPAREIIGERYGYPGQQYGNHSDREAGDNEFSDRWGSYNWQQSV